MLGKVDESIEAPIRARVGLFATGVIQVSLVALNTYQIANKHYLGALAGGFFISLVWTLNVKSVAFGGWPDRLSYALGAMTGTGMGLVVSTLIYGS